MIVSDLGEEVSSPSQEVCRAKAWWADVRERIPALVGGGGNDLGGPVFGLGLSG